MKHSAAVALLAPDNKCEFCRKAKNLQFAHVLGKRRRANLKTGIALCEPSNKPDGCHFIFDHLVKRIIKLGFNNTLHTTVDHLVNLLPVENKKVRKVLNDRFEKTKSEFGISLRQFVDDLEK